MSDPQQHMVRKGMLDDVDTPAAQIAKEALRIAESSHGMHPLAPQVLQRLRRRQSVNPMCICSEERHLQSVRRRSFLQGPVFGRAVDHNDIGIPYMPRRLAQRSCRQ
jgi:hypothetical protein